MGQPLGGVGNIVGFPSTRVKRPAAARNGRAHGYQKIQSPWPRPPLGWFESKELSGLRGGFRSWGGCLDTLIITYSLGVSGTCADSIA
eukprot:2918446-Prymnesium_polylepis.1